MNTDNHGTTTTDTELSDITTGTGSEGIPQHLIGTGTVEPDHPTGKPRNHRTRFENRLWNRVNISNPHDCWEFRTADGGVFEEKYPTFWVKDQTRRVHRVVYAYVHGDIPDGHIVHHECGNTHCVNPRHLKCITAEQNSKRAYVEGQLRTPAREKALEGIRNSGILDSMPEMKISTAEAREIKHEYAERDVSHQDLADEYDVSKSTITRILNDQRHDLP